MMANQAEAERSRRARIILALAEEQAAGKLLEAGKLIDQSPSAIKFCKNSNECKISISFNLSL